jgi:hypothetical protein
VVKIVKERTRSDILLCCARSRTTSCNVVDQIWNGPRCRPAEGNPQIASGPRVMAPIDRNISLPSISQDDVANRGRACGPRISFPSGHRPEGRRISPGTDPPLHNKKAQPATPSGVQVWRPWRVDRQPRRGTAHNARTEVGRPRASAAWTERRPSLPHGPPLHKKGPARRGSEPRRWSPNPRKATSVLQVKPQSATVWVAR